MDDFGVLVKNYGIQPRGKSAPMAASKKTHQINNTNNNNNNNNNNNSNSYQDPIFFSNATQNPNSTNGSLLDDQNDIFSFKGQDSYGTSSSSKDAFDDVFNIPTNKSSGLGSSSGGTGGFDFDVGSMFDVNGSGKSVGLMDDFGGGVVPGDDLLSSDPVDDFWRKLDKMGLEERRDESNKVENSDDLLPGFGINTTANGRTQTLSSEKNSGMSSLDELEDFVTNNVRSTPVKNKVKKLKHTPMGPSFIDIDGIPHGVQTMEKESVNIFQTEEPDLDFIFRRPTQKSVPPSKDKFMNKEADVVSNLFPGPSKPEKKISQRNLPDDLFSMFDDVPSSQFVEVDGESSERREARFQRWCATQARMARAVEEMNQRDFQAKQEQEERHRVADTMDAELKRWAAGKEGNLRALLSSLQQVLGPEYGWTPLTLTDLITSAQVKIAYKKAALCVHPDKVQQKGAQQKYVAEKIFDLLKESWNKFNTEELR